MNSKKYDVVVCGAGAAGVAAAIAAARQGMKTALIEKQCLIGGLATSGLIYVYLPLCDGYGNQVLYGLPEEMIRQCTEYGPFDVPEGWGGPKCGYPGVKGERFQCCFSPAGFTLTLDRMLREAEVDLWLDTVIVGVKKNGNAVSSVTVFNSSGMVDVEGKCFVDATGGAYLVQLAGGKVHRTENRVTPWVIEMSDEPDFFHFTGPLHIQGAWKSTPGGSLESTASAPVCSDCSTGKSVTEFVRHAWQLIRNRYDEFSGAERRRSVYPVHLPAMPQLRKIAHINALRILSDSDRGETFPDSVGKAGDWRRPAPVWDTPYRSLVPRDVKHVLAAGRCTGTSGDAWEVYRVIPVAAMTGEAAGVAAALCAGLGISPEKLNYDLLKKTLDLARKRNTASGLSGRQDNEK